MGQLGMAMELPFVLVGSVILGGIVGYWLDRMLHTGPWLLLSFGLLGFAGGLREVLRRLGVAGGGDGGGDGPDRDNNDKP
jgi:F0F1-type ATP synthase assembly protein I